MSDPTITIDGYLGQHLAGNEAQLTDEIRANGAETVRRVNLLLDMAAQDGVYPTVDPETDTYQSSGWRPAGVNAATSNAADHSRHITGEALDVRGVDRALSRWACSEQGRAALAKIGLWCERPQWCPHWLHCQTCAPASGNRFFIPSNAPPQAPLLPGEGP